MACPILVSTGSCRAKSRQVHLNRRLHDTNQPSRRHRSFKFQYASFPGTSARQPRHYQQLMEVCRCREYSSYAVCPCGAWSSLSYALPGLSFISAAVLSGFYFNTSQTNSRGPESTIEPPFAILYHDVLMFTQVDGNLDHNHGGKFPAETELILNK